MPETLLAYHGDPNVRCRLKSRMRKGESTPVIDRVMRRVTQRDGCWEWPGSVSGRYGHVKGEGGHGAPNLLVHRVVYEHYVGPIPEGLTIDHLCRNTICCNPDHLEAVPHKVNVRRGVGPTAINAVKTHCIHGHPFDSSNTRIDKTGGRQCRECHRIRTNERRARARVSR